MAKGTALVEPIARYIRGKNKQLQIKLVHAKKGDYYTVRNLRNDEWGMARVPVEDMERFVERLGKTRNVQREWVSLHKYTAPGRKERFLNMTANMVTVLENWYDIDSDTLEFIKDTLNNIDLDDIDRFIDKHEDIWSGFWDNYDALVKRRKSLTVKDGKFYDEKGNQVTSVKGSKSSIIELLELLESYAKKGRRGI